MVNRRIFLGKIFRCAINSKLKCLINRKHDTNQERNKKMFGINECSICGGRGYNRVPCDRCGGTGYREHLDSNGDWVREYCDKCNGGKEIDIECSCRK